MQVSLELSNKLRNMSFVCMVLLLIGHSPGGEVDGFVNNFVSTFLRGGGAIYVPVFFMISGYLFGAKLDDNAWYKRGVRKRIRTLMIPFFILNTIWYPIMFISHWLGVKYCGALPNSAILDTSVVNVLKWLGIIPVVHPALGPLWYVRALFLYVLVSPLYVPILRKGKFYAYAVLTVVLLAHIAQLMFHDSFPMNFELNVKNVFFFVAGIIFAIYPVKVHIQKFLAIIFLLGLPWLAAKYMVLLPNQVIASFLKMLVSCCAAFSLWNLIPTTTWSYILTRNNFAIYVMHGMVMISASFVLKFIGCWNAYSTTVGKIPNALVALILSILIAEGLRRFLPKFACLAFGGR